jgi:hypothetical protein
VDLSSKWTNSVDLFYKVALSSTTAPQIYRICGSQFHMNEWHRFVPQSRTFVL